MTRRRTKRRPDEIVEKLLRVGACLTPATLWQHWCTSWRRAIRHFSGGGPGIAAKRSLCTPNPEVLVRTATPRASTVACEMSSSRWRSSTASAMPGISEFSWRHEYNTQRLHSSLGYRAAAKFAAAASHSKRPSQARRRWSGKPLISKVSCNPEQFLPAFSDRFEAHCLVVLAMSRAPDCSTNRFQLTF